ncbi:Arc family DNA-binding protein [Companilactobacillus ginsenosidimutans]|uniref:Pilus assembly protein HicB n=1 Tax=Companilactobacillus ginsenosidimutans TaxID=1007676 RepID=A0A0H4R2R9_9LACO|nr:Arc family DNA-binding protein [Companilactobacillus ginsenosidimutans]AKP68050.1 pilus assembly protein HicB [Companilactobacillus ginsenosidimutans]
MADKKFLLRLDQALYDQIAARAKTESRSVNNYIVHLLEKSTKNESLEGRQFVGRTIQGSDILTDSGLVSVNGIYYRYILANTKSINEDSLYTIIEANGNILTLEELK